MAGLSQSVKEVFLSLGWRVRKTPPLVQPVHHYRAPARALAAMGPEGRQATTIGVEPADARPRMYDIWKRTNGGLKYHHYFGVYEDIARRFGDRSIRLLEIGVFRGASLAMWRQYLPADSLIVGLDIDPETKKYERADEKVHVRVGDQSDAVFLAGVVAEFGPFDLIIDDGSHVSSHMKASFNALFLDGLKAGGYYVVEDTHTLFWNTPSMESDYRFRVYRDEAYSFHDYAKDLTDFVNWHHIEHNETHFEQGASSRLTSLETPAIAAALREVRFVDSMIVFSKKAAPGLPTAEST